MVRPPMKTVSRRRAVGQHLLAVISERSRQLPHGKSTFAAPIVLRRELSRMAASWIAKSQEGRAGSFENRMRVITVTERRGTGNECVYCHKAIDALAVEHCVEAAGPGGVRTLHFHRVCHHLWESQETHH